MIYQAKQAPTLKIEAMRWNGMATMHVNHPDYSAEEIVEWVNDNGGEARYDADNSSQCNRPCLPGDHDARIAVRTINGPEYAAPDHYVVMGSEWFDAPHHHSGTKRVRDFYPVTDLSQVRHIKLDWRPVENPPYVPRCNELEPGCAEEWPDASADKFNPACCRFPKSCSAERCTKDRGHEEHGDVMHQEQGSKYAWRKEAL